MSGVLVLSMYVNQSVTVSRCKRDPGLNGVRDPEYRIPSWKIVESLETQVGLDFQCELHSQKPNQQSTSM